MACEFICDGCGKRAPGESGADHNWHKPPHWFERTEQPSGRILDACSRECVERVNEKSDHPMPIFPLG